MFPLDLLVQAMNDMNFNIQVEEPLNHCNQNISDSLFYPIMSVAQSEKLEKLMNKLKEACSQNNLLNVSTSDVMELYEYKLASLGHAERAAMASAEAASQRSTHLQHRTAQLTAELSRAHQILFHTQQRHESVYKEKEEYIQKHKELCSKIDSEKGRNKVLTNQLASKEKLLTEKEIVIENSAKKIKELEEAKIKGDEQICEFKNVISKLEDSLLKMENQLKKKEELISKANNNNEYLKMVCKIEICCKNFHCFIIFFFSKLMKWKRV